MSKLYLSLLSVALLCTSACSFIARDAEDYRKVTRELVESRGGDIKSCYDRALETNESVSGTVLVNFTVEKKTGKVLNPKIDEAKTTAPAEISQCIVQAIDGLQLAEPDAREGQATFSWEFKVGAPKSS
ncbi:AgmX/PglI C-terminal domain-containing protein [Nannocystaceae bacterium ST9]